MKIGAHRKGQHTKEITVLYHKINTLELAHKTTLAQATLKKLTVAGQTLNTILLDRVKAQLSRCRCTFHKFGG